MAIIKKFINFSHIYTGTNDRIIKPHIIDKCVIELKKKRNKSVFLDYFYHSVLFRIFWIKKKRQLWTTLWSTHVTHA